MQMRKDYSRDELGFPVELRRTARLEEAASRRGVVGRREQLRYFHSEISSGHKTMPVRGEGESSTSPSELFRELSLFRSLLDICRYCTAERAPRHSVECVESYFTNRYANIVSVWFLQGVAPPSTKYISRAVSSLPPQQHFNFSLLAISPTLSFSFSFPFSLGFFSSRARAAR